MPEKCRIAREEERAVRGAQAGTWLTGAQHTLNRAPHGKAFHVIRNIGTAADVDGSSLLDLSGTL